MKKKPASKSAFFNQRVLIGFSFCLIGLVLALAAFNAYPGGNAFARQEVKGASAGVRQNATAPASKLPQLAMVEDDQAVDSSIIAPVVPPHPDVIGATFVVNTTNDTADAAPGDGVCLDGAGACSLRAAISEANALAGADTITLPAGTYTTTLVAANEDLNAGGDFDIRSDVTINGAGSATTIIQANAAPNTATEKVIHITTATATAVNINNVTIRNGNSTVNTLGGGVRIDNAANVVNFTNCIISGNRVIIAGNAFAGGLGITAGSVTLTGCTISGNSAVASVTTGNGFAGGIYNQQATVNLVNSTLTGNFASSFHGGVRALASTTAVAITNITNSTISNNQAQGQNTTAGGGPGEGGGLVNIAGSTFAATMTVTGSTINGNAAQVLGVPGVGTAAGGIENFSVSTGPAVVNVTNSTISGNTAEIAGGGYSDGAVATVTYKFSTIASNSATGSGGGIYQDVTAGGVTNLKDSIVADNTATTSGNDIFGTITSQNYNHLESTAGGTFAAMANDVVSGDPALGALANNGGPTFTHLPGGASVVLNTIPNGTNECGSIAVDQRALVRPSGAGCEKGSVEVQVAASPTPSPTPSVTPTPTTTPTPTPSVTPSPGGVPANDQCAGAIVIPPAGPFPFLTAAVDVTNATITGDPPLPSCQTSVSRSIWYTFTPAVTGSYTISSCQTDAPACTLPDDVIAIYTSAAGCAGPFTQLAGVAGCDDDSCTTLALQAIISNTTLNAGTQYYIVAQKFNTTAPTAGAASIQFRVSLATPASPTPTPSGTITPPASPTPGVSVVWGMWTTPATGAGTARLVTFSPTAPQTFTIIGDTGINTTSNFPNGLDFDAANNLFATGGTNTNFLFSVNQTTGLATVIGGSGLAAGQTVVDLAFDRFNNRMLAIGSGTNPVLLQINTATGAATALGTITGTTETVAVSLAVRASDGAIFMHGVATDRWYNVNPTTFVATPLAVLPFDTNFGQGGTFDPNNGTLYHAAFNSTAFQGQLWTIDPATGTATFVGNMGDTTNPQPNQVSDIAIKLSGPPATPTPTPSISPGITPTPPPSPTPTPTPSATPSPCGVNTFTNSAAITIPDSGPGVPYPSNISVAGLTGTITKVTVTLNSLSHTFPSDVDILLVSPGGQNAIIMSDVGGGNPGITGVTFTLDDAAAAPIPATNFVAGTYRPTNSGTGDTFPAPAPAPAGGSPLSVFNGGAPNGTWALYVVDDAALDLGNLSGGWTLNISTTTGTCATPTPGTPTPSPSCPPASNVIVDGTFEAGTPWTAWTVQTSTNFGTPMCDAGCGTGGGTAGGFGGSANWAWFGGTASAETATTGQSVVIASGGSASLTFQLWIGAVNTPFTDVLNVRVDGTIVATFTEPTTAEVGYTLRTVNLNAFANGASHAILFEYIGPGGAVSNFSVDNISLTAGGTCATPTPSASPSASPSCAPGWSAGPVFPTAAILRAPGNYFPANGRFYSIGGRTSDLVGSDTTHPFEYDPVANSWATKPSTLPDLQVNNMACGVLTVSGTPQIYCVGGSQATVVGNASRVFSYNPATDTFTTLAAGDNWPGSQAGTFLPGGFAVNGNKLYIIGSFNANAVPPVMTNQVWQFDPTAAVGSKWVARANYPQARGYVPAASIGGFIYTGGGAALDGAGTLIDSVESFKYDVTGDAWTAIANIPRATGETRAVVMNGTMWVLGGGRTPPNPGAQVDIFDPVAGTWSAGLPLDSIGRRNFPADSNGTDRIFLAGGYDNLASQVNTMRIFGAGACASPTPSPSIAPSATPSATIGVSPTPGVSPSPGVSPTPGVSPSPGVSPTPGASATPGVTPPAQAVNFSTRMRVLTGDRVGIGGFIVTGSGPKNVLVRAIGPSLVRFGIDPADVLADPTLELHGPTGFTTVNNNNWKENPVQRDLIEATGLPPTNDLESAIVATLNPGQYTAVVKGNGNTTGVALVEVYDLNQSSGSKLANISTRAFVSVDDDIVIAGFILGNSPGVDSIIVRGIGPSLAAFGVSTVLANPTLELRDNNGSLLFANNDWQDNPAQAALITAAGLAPSNNLEAAIAATLPPGLYTALLAGLNGGTGNGLVEVYDRGAAGGGGPAPTPTPSPTPPGGTPSPSPSVSPGISPSPTPPGVTPTPTPPASPTPSPATCTEAFDGVTAPALPAGWTASNEGSPPDNGVRWVTNTLTPDSAPNSAFVDDQNGVSDKYMVTRNIAINSGAPKITFRNFFSTEYDPPPTEEFWDGYVLEISRDNGATWADITDPAPNGGAGTFVTGGYTGEINGIASNPLAGRQAWSGENTGYISTEINLGSHLNGQTVKLRFRMGSDLFSPGDGVHVDSLVINGGACP